MGGFTLVIDQGGHSSRAVAVDRHGQLIAKASVAVETSTPKSGWVEQDPLAVITSIERAIAELAAQLNLDFPGGYFTSAALVTQRSSIVCWHRVTGEPLSPVISWQDTRAADLLVRHITSRAEVRKITGLYPNAHFGASKIRWCLENIPGLSDLAASNDLVIGPLAAFIQQRLCGTQEVSVDGSNAARTLLFNIHTLQWDSVLLSQWKIPLSILPTVKNCLTDWGELRVNGAPVPLRLVSGDQSAAFAGLLMGQENTAIINSGTGAFVAAPIDLNRQFNQCETGKLLCSLVHMADEKQATEFVLEGTVNGAASALNWAVGQLNLQGELELDSWCGREKDIPLFINAVGGIGPPYWRSDIASRFIGDDLDCFTPAAKMVAVLESILFLLMENITALQQSNIKLQRLVVAGGLSGIDAFCQKLANLSKLLVCRSEEPEASARGAAWLLLGKPDWVVKTECFTARSDRAIQSRYRNWQAEMNRLVGSEPAE